MNPQDLPPPDLLDSGPRIRRAVIALLAGVAAGAIAYMLASSAAEPDHLSNVGGSASRAYKFVFSVTALVGIIVFTIVLKVQKHFADKKYVRELVPQARAKR